MKPKDLLTVGSLVAIGATAFGAFSRPSRREIWSRAHGKSELSNRSDRPRECSHNNHYFSNYNHRSYNSPENGLLVTDIEHYTYHLLFRNDPYKIGLSEEGNEYALDAIYDRIMERRPMSNDVFHREVQRASGLWVAKLGIES